MHYYSVFKDRPDLEAKFKSTAAPSWCQLSNPSVLLHASSAGGNRCAGNRLIPRRETESSPREASAQVLLRKNFHRRRHPPIYRRFTDDIPRNPSHRSRLLISPVDRFMTVRKSFRRRTLVRHLTWGEGNAEPKAAGYQFEAVRKCERPLFLMRLRAIDVFFADAGLLCEMAQEPTFQFFRSVNRDRKPSRVSGLAIDVMSAVDAQQLRTHFSTSLANSLPERTFTR